MGKCIKCGKETGSKYTCYSTTPNVIARGANYRATRVLYEDFERHDEYLCKKCLVENGAWIVMVIFSIISTIWGVLGILYAYNVQKLNAPRYLWSLVLGKDAKLLPIFNLMSSIEKQPFFHITIGFGMGVACAVGIFITRKVNKKEVGENMLIHILRKDSTNKNFFTSNEYEKMIKEHGISEKQAEIERAQKIYYKNRD